MKAVSCPCCAQPMNVKTDKRKHPYLSCGACGVMCLVHKDAGVKAFSARYGWTPEATGAAPAVADKATSTPAPAPAPAPTPAPVQTGGGHRARRQAR